ECISLEKFPVHGKSAVLTKLIKRRFGLWSETNFISPRFFQKQARQNKQRIGNRAGLDLRNHIFEYVLTREETNCSLEWLWRRLGSAVRQTAIFTSIGIATPGASFFGHSATLAPVVLGPRLLSLSSPFPRVEFSISLSASSVAAAQFGRHLF